MSPAEAASLRVGSVVEVTSRAPSDGHGLYLLGHRAVVVEAPADPQPRFVKVVFPEWGETTWTTPVAGITRRSEPAPDRLS